MTNAGDPIVLVHGIFGFGQLPLVDTRLGAYFRGVRLALAEDGYLVADPPQLNPAGSISQRAGDLKSYLEDPANADVFGRKVHVVAHSMGGLDTRYMISRLGMADRVLSLTTVGTPHHGSPIADLVTGGSDPRLVTLIDLLKFRGIGDLTTSKCAAFNLECPEAAQVRYYAVAGHFEPQRALSVPLCLLGLTHDLIQSKEGDNDGLVSIRSATFGSDPAKWTYLGDWEANHFRLVNWGTDLVLTPAELSDDTIIDNYRAIAARVIADARSRGVPAGG